jgi:CO/xanthine dehydrogenase Mo-binding subunit
VPAAIANAFFDATGVRLRTIPFTPDSVKVALSGAERKAA